MHSLFLRFFLSFWLIIGITIGAAATSGFWYAERVQDAIDHFELEDPLLAGSSALETGGRTGLTNWLRSYPATRGITLYVIDDDGKDILDRPLSGRISGAVRRHQEFQRSRSPGRNDPRNVRRSRHLPQLVGANGDTFTFFVSTSRIREAIWGATDVRLLLLTFALLVSGAVSYALASAISRPVRQLRSATVTLADGDLDVRLANTIGNRRDELGMLGRDFDTMATKLQRAARQQTELSRNISHELRSPLARMRVAVELARGKAGELSEFSRLDDEAERLDGLIGQILSYTRLDSTAKPAPLDLEDVVQEVVENVNYECRADGMDGVDVQSKIDASPTNSRDRGAIASADENVLRNAVRHSPPQQAVTLTLRQSGNEAVIDILDQGPGVDDAALGHLFDAFYRTRRSVEDLEDRGTGLGLAIAKRALNSNDGSIAASNAADGGLLVTLRLPLARD